MNSTEGTAIVTTATATIPQHSLVAADAHDTADVLIRHRPVLTIPLHRYLNGRHVERGQHRKYEAIAYPRRELGAYVRTHGRRPQPVHAVETGIVDIA